MPIGHKSRNKRHATATTDRSAGGSFIRGLVSGAVFCLAILLLGYMFMHIRTERVQPDGIVSLTDLLDPSSSSETVIPLSELLSIDTTASQSPPLPQQTAVHAIVARPLKQRQIGDGMVPPTIATETGTAENNPDISSLAGLGKSSSSSSSSGSGGGGGSGSSHLRTTSSSTSSSSSTFTDLLKFNISSLLPHYTQVVLLFPLPTVQATYI